MKFGILGSHETNEPWAFELVIMQALRELGHDVWAIDYRKGRPPNILSQPNDPVVARYIRTMQDAIADRRMPDVYLVFRGEGFPWRHVAQFQSKHAHVALWVAESMRGDNAMAEFNRQQLQRAVPHVNTLFLHDGAYGRECWPRADWWHELLCVAMQPPTTPLPNWNSRDLDVVWVGSRTHYRTKFLHELEHHMDAARVKLSRFSGVFGDDLDRLYRRTKIALNIHMSEEPNTETRIAEVVRAEALLVTEPLAHEIMPSSLYVEESTPETMAKGIGFYLNDVDLAQWMAHGALEYMLAHHTVHHRVRQMIDYLQARG